MHHLSTAFLIYALAIVVNQVGATAHFYTYEEKSDQLATEAKNRAVTIIDGPKYVAPASTPPPVTPANHTQPDKRPPSKPPINTTPDKHGKPKYIELPRIYIGQLQNTRNPYPKPVKVHSPNSVYKYQKVIPLQPNRNTLYPKHQQLVFSASTSKPSISPKSPKFSLPIETINGIRADFVRPPHQVDTTTTSTTTTATTTTRYLRTKRIWPKHILEKQKASNVTGNATGTNTATNYTNTDNELSSSASHQRIKIILSDKVISNASTTNPSTRPPYRKVTRVPKKKPSTPAPANFTTFEPNDWVPIVPSHYPVKKVRQQTHIRSRRSDRSEIYLSNPNETPAQSKSMLFLQSFGLLPVESSPSPTAARKNIIYVGKTKKLKPHVYSGYRGKPGVHTAQNNGDYQTDESSPPMKILTKIKHHHHHHHHRYVKTVEKPVRVEVPKEVPVPVPVPVPVRVEHKVPYPVKVQVPHPVPVKVIEKEYVPKPYPVVQQVPVIKHVQVKVPHPVPVHIEKKVPYPVRVEVPVPKPYPVAVPVEKKVPYPVPVRILVPQPYPVETKVPVHIKEPVEVIKHVPVKVPVPQPYPVKVPHPVPVPYEKKVPYPVEVEKKVPVPYKVIVPEKVEVEKKVPVYVPRPYPVEKKVPVPVKVPYPVRVPIRVPVGVPILVHPSPNNDEHVVSSGVTVGPDGNNNQPQLLSQYAYSVSGNTVTSSPPNTVTVYGNSGTENLNNINNIIKSGTDHLNNINSIINSGTDHLNNINSIINTITDSPHQIVTVHGKTGVSYQQQQGFQSRSDTFEESTTPYSTTQSTSIRSTSSSTESTLPAFSTEASSDITTSISTPDPR